MSPAEQLGQAAPFQAPEMCTLEKQLPDPGCKMFQLLGPPRLGSHTILLLPYIHQTLVCVLPSTSVYFYGEINAYVSDSSYLETIKILCLK